MTPYAKKHLPPEDVALWMRLRDIIDHLPDLDLGTDSSNEPVHLSCHNLSRAVARIFNLRVVDGFVVQGFEHSWVVTKKGSVIDLYPTATLGGPILVDQSTYSRLLYRSQHTRKISRGRFSKRWFRNATRKIERAIRNIMKQ